MGVGGLACLGDDPYGVLAVILVVGFGAGRCERSPRRAGRHGLGPRLRVVRMYDSVGGDRPERGWVLGGGSGRFGYGAGRCERSPRRAGRHGLVARLRVAAA